MDFLMISEYFLMFCLAVFLLASLKITARKTTATALAGVSGITITISVFLILVYSLHGLEFCKDIALALIVLSPVGTIALSQVLKGES
ncbi:MAG: monovalent cation/H+ antiporter complex subunit F [Methanobacteriaceae archaeon]|nr:monovalent cation/H+ antiporter complex subunit F [Methanobacteriaceae archaeon]